MSGAFAIAENDEDGYKRSLAATEFFDWGGKFTKWAEDNCGVDSNSVSFGLGKMTGAVACNVGVNALIPGASAFGNAAIFAATYGCQAYSSSCQEYIKNNDYENMSAEANRNAVTKGLWNAGITMATTMGSAAIVNSNVIEQAKHLQFLNDKNGKPIKTVVENLSKNAIIGRAGQSFLLHTAGDAAHQYVNTGTINPVTATITGAMGAVATYAIPSDATEKATSNEIMSAGAKASGFVKNLTSEIVKDARGSSHSFEYDMLQKGVNYVNKKVTP